MARIDYTARFRRPAYIERDRDTYLGLGIYYQNALVAPSSATISVYDANGLALVNGATVTTVSPLTYVLPTATVASSTLGAGWRVAWSCLMPDGLTHVFEQMGALCRKVLAPVTADVDLYRKHPDLVQLRPTGQTSYQDFIDDAVEDRDLRLEGKGRRPYLVMSPEALRPFEIAKTLEGIFRSFGGTGDPDNKYNRLADMYEKKAEAAWSSTDFVYDETDDGAAGVTRRKSSTGTLWLCGRAP